MNKAEPPLPPVALIAGPTASGKSALALALAERVGGTVINADSAQVYRDLRIFSARPSSQEEAWAPHELYGYRDGADPCSAADWAADAAGAIGRAHQSGRLPIVVGGTGLYLNTLLNGIAPVPDILPEVREAVRGLPRQEALAALHHEDPVAAARLRPSDTTRIARALEVVRSTGRPLHVWQQARSGGIGERVRLLPLLLLPPRDWLRDRCDRRFEIMFGRGLDEAAALIERGLPAGLPVMRAIGVPEAAAFLRGTISREQAVALGQGATRRYAKRQYTWFRNQSPADWPRWETPLGEAEVERALPLLLPRDC